MILLAVPYFPTVSWLELAWFAVAVRGGWLTMWNLLDAVRDRRHLLRNKAEVPYGQRLFAELFIGQGVWLTVVLAGLLALGIVAAVLPGRTPAPGMPLHWSAIASPVALFANACGIWGLAEYTHRQRVRIKQALIIADYRNTRRPRGDLIEASE